MHSSLVNANGSLVQAEMAVVPLLDRGFLYGDSLYEVVRTLRGRFLHMSEHLARLEKSAELCRIRLPQPLDFYAKEIRRTTEAFWNRAGFSGVDAYIRLIVTRGTGRIGFSRKAVVSPAAYYIIVKAIDPPSKTQLEKGLCLRVSSRIRLDRRALDPAMKSGNYLNSVLAFLEAEEEGFDDAILCDADGHVTEGTTFNVFYCRRGILATPPLDIGILDGITRKEVLKSARASGIPAREVRFPKERLYEADEVFVTGTVREVFPVTRVDDRSVGDGKPGPMTTRLAALYRETIGSVA